MLGEFTVIVNPTAANGKVGKLWPDVEDFLRSQEMPFSFVFTEYPRHAISLAREAVEKGARCIIAFGGDGTLNEVLNGMLYQGPRDDLILGVIPGGTGADFAKTLGLPREPISACRHLIEGKTRCIDLGEIECFRDGKPERRYFINVAGLGFDAEVAERTNRAPKILGGTVPYLASLVISLIAYRKKKMTLLLDGHTIEQKAYMVAVAIGQYFGGGMHIAPNASPDDGLFDVVVVGDTTKLDFLKSVPRVYKGTHLDHPKVDSYRASHVEVQTDEKVFIQAEGELVGTAPAVFRMHHKAVKLLV